MNNKYKTKKKKNTTDNEVERIFDVTWNNWASRRACERTHLPEYIKRQAKKEKENND